MAKHTLSILYGSKVDEDAVAVLVFINALAKRLGVPEDRPLELDQQALASVLQGIRADFPHPGGLPEASVFKKVGNFIVHFIAQGPIVSPFPAGTLNPKLRAIPNHQNAFLALELGISALHGATVQRADGTMELVNPISISQHSYVDIVEALSDATVATHWRLVCVLLEQLCYRANPYASYSCTSVPPKAPPPAASAASKAAPRQKAKRPRHR